jgi:hypothetical protein
MWMWMCIVENKCERKWFVINLSIHKYNYKSNLVRVLDRVLHHQFSVTASIQYQIKHHHERVESSLHVDELTLLPLKTK